MIDLLFLIKILTTIVFSITLCNLSNKIAKKLLVLDYPDQVRKLHKKPMPQTGGIIIYSSIILNFFFSKNYNYDLSYIIWISLFFLLGFLDDKFNIHWAVKFIIPVIFITTFLSHNNHFIINEIYSDFFKNNLIIKNTYKLNFIFTILCIVLLLNAINMIDGHNGTCIIYFIFCILFLVFQNTNNNLNEILIIILPSAIVTAYYNINNKLFIGNCGSFLISGIISYYLIKNNNYYEKISAEKIFLLLIIPGLDMLRLFISRIINKKNPFSSDRNHLHHLLLNSNKKYNLKYFFYFLIMFLPSILSLLKIFSNLNLIIISTLFYIFIIIKLNKNYKIFFLKK